MRSLRHEERLSSSQLKDDAADRPEVGSLIPLLAEQDFS